MNATEMSNRELKAIAPSIFAEEPWSGVSPRYTFIPTIQVVDALRDSGFAPVQASQSKVRIPGKAPFTKHMLRFRSKEDAKKYPRVVDGNAHHFFKNAPDIVEVVLVNAHDRSAAYGLDAGIWRLICSNGLVAFSANFGSIHVRHSGNIIEEVLAESHAIVRTAPIIQQQIKAWKDIDLSPAHRTLMAQAALLQRWGKDDSNNLLAPIPAEALLAPRRKADEDTDLWTTMNVIQENMMKGELIGLSRNGRKTHTRAIQSVNTTLSLNRNIWALAEAMAETVH
jgi:hypothetical protein